MFVFVKWERRGEAGEEKKILSRRAWAFAPLRKSLGCWNTPTVPAFKRRPRVVRERNGAAAHRVGVKGTRCRGCGDGGGRSHARRPRAVNTCAGRSTRASTWRIPRGRSAPRSSRRVGARREARGDLEASRTPPTRGRGPRRRRTSPRRPRHGHLAASATTRRVGRPAG